MMAKTILQQTGIDGRVQNGVRQERDKRTGRFTGVMLPPEQWEVANPYLLGAGLDANGDPQDSWDKQRDEPMLWFRRFETFRLLGPGRTIVEAWRQSHRHLKSYSGVAADSKGKKTRTPSKQWREMAEFWHWQERAEAWDLAEVARLRREYAQEAEDDKRERIKLLKAARAKLIPALAGLDTDRVKLGEVYTALRQVIDELRSEYDDQPTRRVELSDEELNAAIRRGLAQLDTRRQMAAFRDDPEGVGGDDAQ